MELNKIYNMDCMEGLAKISSNEIDCIITDPPYCVGTTSNGRQGSWSDNNLIIPFFDKLFCEWKRVLKDKGYIYMNTDWRTYPLLYPIFCNYFVVKNCIVWDYGWIKAGSHYRFSHEFIIFGLNNFDVVARNFSASERDVWRIKPVNFTDKNKLHHAQKPEELIRKMINHGSNPGDVILDCFIGSGTTIKISIESNRQFIGFEIDKNIFKIASDRIVDLIVQKDIKRWFD